MLDDGKLSNFSEAKALFDRGNQAYIKKDYLRALDNYKKSLQIIPGNNSVLENMGFIYYDTGRYDLAGQYFKHSISMKNPGDSGNSFYGMALIQLKNGEKDAAIVNFKKYLKKNPKGFFSRKAMRTIDDLQ